jgi:hypothetical protein
MSNPKTRYTNDQSTRDICAERSLSYGWVEDGIEGRNPVWFWKVVVGALTTNADLDLFLSPTDTTDTVVPGSSLKPHLQCYPFLSRDPTIGLNMARGIPARPPRKDNRVTGARGRFLGVAALPSVSQQGATGLVPCS